MALVSIWCETHAFGIPLKPTLPTRSALACGQMLTSRTIQAHDLPVKQGMDSAQSGDLGARLVSWRVDVQDVQLSTHPIPPQNFDTDLIV